MPKSRKASKVILFISKTEILRKAGPTNANITGNHQIRGSHSIHSQSSEKVRAHIYHLNSSCSHKFSYLEELLHMFMEE